MLWPNMPGGEYEQLSKVANPDLLKELNALDLYLYGGGCVPWDGKLLADCMAEWRQVSTARDTSELPALYPDDPTGSL